MHDPLNRSGIGEGGSLPPWAEPLDVLASRLRADPELGLSVGEAERRLREHGPNELESDPPPVLLQNFARQFRSLIVWVMLGACALSAALGDALDALAIGAIVLLNAAIGTWTEYRADSTIAALRRMAAPVARVVRGGRTVAVPAREVVPGDLLVFEAGDRVEADARLVGASMLRVNEAPLTGESLPVEKGAVVTLPPQTLLASRRNMAYMGTSVTAGQGRAVVVGVGRDTEVGRIAEMLRTAGRDETPLQRRLEGVSRQILFASLGVIAVVFALGLARGEAPGRMFLTAVSLAVAAVPEGLPAVVTVALALGVGRMARRHALVRRLPAVETLGSTQVICSDKTGTLTRGEMTVRALWMGGSGVEVTGGGYLPQGEFLEGDTVLRPSREPLLRELLYAAAACNEAELTLGELAEVVGDPTEGALLAAAGKIGLFRSRIEEEAPRIRTFPFDSDRKRMSVVRETSGGPRAYVKGAPDLLLSHCVRVMGRDGETRPLTEGERAAVHRANEDLAGRAFRVIAVAERDLSEFGARGTSMDGAESDLTFLGLLAMYDSPRAEARDAIARCRAAGVRTVMITGDHPATAESVARELGLLRQGGFVVSGTELLSLTDADLAERVERIAVYARVTAEDKLRIVRAFKARGLVVAMTGDGVNDAPAVKEASIGVAMGRTGTEVTKEAADMVVTDDNFASIAAAIEEGRGIYDNIRKCLQYLLAGNAAEILLMLAAGVLGWPVPLLPLQILWINLVTDGLPALALATDPVRKDLMHQPPRPSDERLADRPFLLNVLSTGILTTSVSLLGFAHGWYGHHDAVLARSYAFSVLVYSELFRSLGVRDPERPLWRSGLRANPRLYGVVALSVALQLLILHVGPFQRVFGVRDVPLYDSVGMLALGLLPMAVLEAKKALGLKLNRRNRGRV